MSSAIGLTDMECKVSAHQYLLILIVSDFYGFVFHSAVLVLYFTQKLMFDDSTATAIFHGSTTLVNLLCIFGAIISDSWLGKYRTILYLSLVCTSGSLIIAIGAIPSLPLPAVYVRKAF